jgi:hypothetical protein
VVSTHAIVAAGGICGALQMGIELDKSLNNHLLDCVSGFPIPRP